MRRFRFRLETVLGWRQSRLEAEETRLRRLFEELRRVENARARVEQEKNEGDRAVLYAQSADAADLEALASHRAHCAREMERLASERARCERRIAEQRQRLLEAERGMRLLEKLRERQYSEWHAEMNREQEAAAAELFLGRWSAERLRRGR
jgi:flagellar export protein FliJ